MARNAQLGACVLGSLAAHFHTIVPALLRVTHARSEQREEQPMQQEPLLHAPPEIERLSLGLDAPSPAKMTWVGFDEYQQHMAALAEVEQAAFIAEAIAAAPPNQTAAPQQVAPDPDALEAQSEPAEVSKIGFTSADLIPFRSVLERLANSRTAEQDRKLLEKAEPRKEKAPETAAQTPAPQIESAPALAQQPQSGANNPGTQADKEAQPTSVIDVPPENWRLGKPLAAQGLELKTRKPEFTLLTLLTAAVGNPVCEIVFDQRGIPVRASILRSTGDKRVDDAVLASLYRWRASGDKLKELADGETIEVHMQLLYSRRR